LIKPNLETKIEKDLGCKALVKTSAIWCWEERWERTMSPSTILERMKWQSTSMCFVLSWKEGFLAS